MKRRGSRRRAAKAPMSSSARNAFLAGLLGLGLLLAGCARETPEDHAVRSATKDYLKALRRRDVAQIAQRSTCLVPTNSLVGARVVALEASRWVRMGDLDSLVKVGMWAQRSADSVWARSDDAHADSLFN